MASPTTPKTTKVTTPARGMKRSYFSLKETSDNGCGQAAVAHLVEYWYRTDLYPKLWTRPFTDPKTGAPGRQKISDPDNLVTAIYKQHPCDTPGAIFGCTPGHVENMFKALGFATRRHCGEAGARAMLEKSIRGGCPVVVLVDQGKINGSGGAHHYMVVHGFSDTSVFCSNRLPQSEGGTIAWGPFLEAWHCWLLNQPVGDWQYAAIQVAPTRQLLDRAVDQKPAPAPLPPPAAAEGEEAEGPRTGGAWGKLIGKVAAAGGAIKIDSQDLARTSDGAAQLSALAADVRKQLKAKTADALRDAQFFREAAAIPTTLPTKEKHFVIEVDTTLGWVGVDWES